MYNEISQKMFIFFFIQLYKNSSKRRSDGFLPNITLGENILFQLLENIITYLQYNQSINEKSRKHKHKARVHLFCSTTAKFYRQFMYACMEMYSLEQTKQLRDFNKCRVIRFVLIQKVSKRYIMFRYLVQQIVKTKSIQDQKIFLSITVL